jgi:hypothetical protein
VAYTITACWGAGIALPVDGVLFIAPTNLTITSVNGRMDVLEDSTITIQPVAVNNGAAISTGTVLTTGPLICNAALATNQNLPVLPPGTMVAGQAIALQVAGTIDVGVGNITIVAVSR